MQNLHSSESDKPEAPPSGSLDPLPFTCKHRAIDCDCQRITEGLFIAIFLGAVAWGAIALLVTWVQG